MEDEHKTKEQILAELAELRQQVAGLKAMESERKRLEEALRRAEASIQKRLHEQIILREAGTVISSSLDLQTVLTRIAEQMCRAVGATSAYIDSYEPETMTSRVLAEYISPQACPEERVSDLGVAYSEEGREEWFEKIKADLYAISHIDDPDLSEVERAYMQEYGAKTVLYIPLRVKGEFIGLAEIWESRRRREFTPDEIALCQGIARLAAVAIENARLHQAVQQELSERQRVEKELRQRTSQLEALRQVGLELTAQLDLDALLHSIVSRAVELLEGDSGMLHLYRPDRDVLEWTVSVGLNQPPPKPILRRGEGLCGRVLETGQPLIVDDYHHWEGRVSGWEDHPFQAVMGMPIRWGEEFLGVLEISRPPPRTFSQADAELLRLLANQAAIAIRNARLYEQAQRRAERLAVVNHIARAVSAVLHLDDLLETVYQEIADVFQPDAFFIALYDEEARELDFRLRVDEGMREPPERRPLGTGLTAVVVTKKKPLLIRDFEKEQDRLPTPGVWGTMKMPASWLGVPMLIGERLVGVISVQAYRPYAYNEEDQELLCTIADQVAVAVEKARLYEMEREQRELAEAMAEATAALTGTLDFDQILDRILEQVSRVVPNDATNIMLIEGDEVRIARWRGYERFGAEEFVSTVVFRIPEVPNLQHMLESREPVVIPDTATYPGWVHVPVQAWLRSYAGVPIIVRDQVIGFLNVDSATPGFFTQTHAEILRVFADHAAAVIKNARLYESERRHSAQLEVLHQASLHLTSTLELQPILEAILDHALRLVDAYDAHVFLYDGELLTFGAALWKNGRREEPYSDPRPHGLTYTVARSGERIVVPDVNSHPLFRGYQWGGAIVGLPLRIGERVVGVMNVAFKEPHEFREEELHLLELLADQAAIAIENARLFEEEKRRARQLALINEVGDKAASILDLDKLMQEVTHFIQESFNYYNVALLLVDEDRHELVMQAIAGGFEHMAAGEYHQPLDEGIMGFVARTGQSWLARDISKDPYYIPGFLGEVLTRSELCVPIKHGGKVIGVLDLQSSRLNDFDELDLVAMEAVADRLAIAIENARLFEETQRRACQLQIVEEVGRKASAILDLDELFPYVTKAIQQNFGYYHVDIFLVEPGSGYVVFKASSDPALEKAWKEQGLRFKIGEEGIIGWVAHTGEPLLANDVSQEPHYLPDELLPQVRSELAVPLKVGEQVVGVLDVDSDKLNAFDQDDLFVLQTLASQIAIAIENARLYEAEQRRRRDAEALRETALALTSALDRNQVIERILTQLQRVVPYDSASVQLLRGDKLVIIGGRGFPNLEEILGLSFAVDGDNPNREVMRTLKPFILEDAPAVYEGFRQEPFAAMGIRSWLGVPMLIGKRPVGMITLDKCEPGFYTEEHARLAQTFAAQAAVAIENARLFEEVEKRRVYLEGVLGAAPDAIVTLDADHRIVEWNPGAERLFGYSPEEAIGQNVDDLIAGPDVRDEAVGYTQTVMSGKTVGPVETIRYRKDGTPVHVIVAGSPILAGKELIGVVAVYTDITERVRMEEELRAMALVDELTGLYNRRGFLTLARQQLKTANRMKTRLSLLFSDFDGLKRINDTFGHAEGDRALRETADVFRQTFRESDIISRIGGDEFVVLALETREDNVGVLIARLRENLAARNAVGDLRYKLSLTVGAARYDPEHPCSIEELMERADRAMYERKQFKKGVIDG